MPAETQALVFSFCYNKHFSLTQCPDFSWRLIGYITNKTFD